MIGVKYAITDGQQPKERQTKGQGKNMPRSYLRFQFTILPESIKKDADA